MYSVNEFTEILQNKPYLNYYLQEKKIDPNYSLKLAKVGNEHFLSYKGKPLSSSFAPQKQAKRQIEAYQRIVKTDILIILGLGNPYLFELLNETLPKNQIILAFDFSITSFHLLWEKFLKRILSVPGRHLFCGRFCLPFFYQYFGSIKAENFSNIKMIPNRGNLEIHRDFYKNIENLIQKDISSKMSDLLTRFELEKCWLKNTISNLSNISTNHKINISFIHSWKGKLENVPAVVVSAGPSLKYHCSWLKENRNKIFLLACDTSLKVLSKFDIVPDGVVTLDAQIHSIFHFLGENLKNTFLFSDFVGHPSINCHLNFQNIVYSVTTKYIPQVDGTFEKDRTAGGKIVELLLEQVGEIQSGGSVATTAFDMLRNFSCSPIFLIGQDLAYTGREIHSTGTYHNEKWLSQMNRKESLEKINERIIQKRKVHYLQSIEGQKVLSDHVLMIYKNWFEETVKCLDFPVYNIGERGVLIEGCLNVSLEKANEIIKNYKPHSFFWKKFQNKKIELDRKQTIEFYLKNLLLEIENLLFKIENQKSFQEIQADFHRFKTIFPDFSVILRKIQIYITRNSKKLEQNKKEFLYIHNLKKELLLFKRKIKKKFPKKA